MGKRDLGPAGDRLFKNVFVCLKCRAKIRAQPDKVKKGLVKCRKCRRAFLRPKAKEKRGVSK